MLLSNYFEGSVTKLKVEIMGNDIINFNRMKSLYCLCKLEINLGKSCCQNILHTITLIHPVTIFPTFSLLHVTNPSEYFLQQHFHWVFSSSPRHVSC
jgi:hypothetical protein